ncbi:hypothetical protein ACFFRR_000984 [Megaselia abdita]
MMTRIIPVVLLVSFIIILCDGHGRLIEPPSRATAWRYGFNTPPNYNDHELYCGGYTRQWKKNEGKCGECGDAFDMSLPRPHEYGGKYGQGVIVRKYNPGSELTIKVELTASHMGFFEFRVCPDVKAKQDCLDKNILEIADGSPKISAPDDLHTRFYPRNGSRIYEIIAKLPLSLKCKKCVLQWKYIAGNNWGMCDKERGAVGCGPQEEFRACSDIEIGEGGFVRPNINLAKINNTLNNPPITEVNSTQFEDISDDTTQGSIFIALLIIFLSFIFVLCILAAIYIYHYHGQTIKDILRWKQDKDSSMTSDFRNDQENKIPTSTIERPPVPPRTKRLPLVREMTTDYTSVV